MPLSKFLGRFSSQGHRVDRANPLVPTCADRNLESEVDPHHRHILRRSAGGVYPVSGADFGNSNSNADYFLLGDLLLSDSLLSDFLPSNFLPSDFLPSDTFVSVHLTGAGEAPQG